MKFDEMAKLHLSNYKKNNLNIIQNGEYNNLAYDHIIPTEIQDENLISFYRDQILSYLKDNNIPLNKYFHHLNSSQSMCLNFFYPLKDENSLNILDDALALQLDNIIKSSFEEKMYDGTTVDFYIEGKRKKIYFEAKYTEQDFGSKGESAFLNRNYPQTFLNNYLPIIGKYFNSLTKYEFYRYYQLFRNYLNVLINDNPLDLLIVIYPKKNIKLDGDFNRFMTILNNKLQYKYHSYKVRRVYWEELLEKIFPELQSETMIEHYKEFQNKYLF